MIKLLVSVTFGLMLAAVMLQLRQESLSLNYQTSKLHARIESRQALLWSQQLRIAEATAPNAIAAKVRQDRIPLAPAARPQAANWLVPQQPQPDAAAADAVPASGSATGGAANATAAAATSTDD